MIFNSDLEKEKKERRISDFIAHCDYTQEPLNSLTCYRFIPQDQDKVMIDLEICDSFKRTKARKKVLKDNVYQLAFYELISYFYTQYHILLKPKTIVSDFIKDHETTNEPMISLNDIEIEEAYKKYTGFYDVQDVACYFKIPEQMINQYIKLGYLKVVYFKPTRKQYIPLESILQFQADHRQDPDNLCYPVFEYPASRYYQGREEEKNFFN